MLLIDTHTNNLQLVIIIQLVTARLSKAVSGLVRFFYPPRNQVESPMWLRCPDRTWQRYSAFIMSRSGSEYNED